MTHLMDSFFRALAYCMLPRVIAWSLLPLLLMGALALGGGYFYWDVAIESVRTLLDSVSLLSPVWDWLQAQGIHNITALLAPVVVLVLVTPLIVLVSLLTVAFLMTPSLVRLVGQRRFPNLARQQGGSLWRSMVSSLGATLLALLALLLSMPLWLIPPLVLIVPPLIWGWLTYRVMAFDALAEHASKAECDELFKRHRMTLLLMGVVCGYLGAAPAIVWASGVLFIATFFILVPLAIWIYTLVFALSSLWFIHFCLAALQQLRDEQRSPFPTPGNPEPNPQELPLVVVAPVDRSELLPPSIS